MRIAVPFPELKPPTAPAPALVDNGKVRAAFFAPLTRDLAYSGIFAIAPLPPSVPVTPELLKRVEAQFYLQLNVWTRKARSTSSKARLIDQTGARAAQEALPRTGSGARRAPRTCSPMSSCAPSTASPGVFLSQIAFASNRTGNWEIWLMDWDGANQRQITRHDALSILPSWSPDNERMVYTSFARGTSDMYIINRRGGGRMRIDTGLALNTSATFSPVSNDIAFVGSVRGNPDIYLDQGRRLEPAPPDHALVDRVDAGVEPERAADLLHLGTQRHAADLRHGRRGDRTCSASRSRASWNDDATWSPDGEQIAYTSRVNGRFQIRIANLITGESQHHRRRRIERAADLVAGRTVDRLPIRPQRRKWQIYRMRADGTRPLQLTFDGENKEPDWSKKPE